MSSSSSTSPPHRGPGHAPRRRRADRRRVFIPLTVGGGVRSVEEMRAVLRAGADKVSVNTAAVADPSSSPSARGGSAAQAVVVSIDARAGRSARSTAGWEVVVKGGREATGLDAVELGGAGRRAGRRRAARDLDRPRRDPPGYDTELLRAITSRVERAGHRLRRRCRARRLRGRGRRRRRRRGPRRLDLPSPDPSIADGQGRHGGGRAPGPTRRGGRLMGAPRRTAPAFDRAGLVAGGRPGRRRRPRADGRLAWMTRRSSRRSRPARRISTRARGDRCGARARPRQHAAVESLELDCDGDAVLEGDPPARPATTARARFFVPITVRADRRPRRASPGSRLWATIDERAPSGPRAHTRALLAGRRRRGRAEGRRGGDRGRDGREGRRLR